MTAPQFRPWVRGRRWEPMRTLGALLCVASALGVLVLAVWAAPLLMAVGR